MLDHIGCVNLGNENPALGDLVDNACGGQLDCCTITDKGARSQRIGLDVPLGQEFVLARGVFPNVYGLLSQSRNPLIGSALFGEGR